RRRAKEPEVARVERVLECRLGAAQREMDLELIPGALADTLAQAIEREEVEALGKGEVFLQQAVALEAASCDRKQRLVVLEPDLADARGGSRGDGGARLCRSHVEAD